MEEAKADLIVLDDVDKEEDADGFSFIKKTPKTNEPLDAVRRVEEEPQKSLKRELSLVGDCCFNFNTTNDLFLRQDQTPDYKSKNLDLSNYRNLN